MVKATKFFRKQAVKAERAARATPDEETSQNLSALAQAYRSQADVLKSKKKEKRLAVDAADRRRNCLGKKPGDCVNLSAPATRYGPLNEQNYA